MPQTKFSEISDKYNDEIKDSLLDAFRNIHSSLEAKISNKKDLSDLILHQNRQLSSEDIKLQQKPESFTKDNIIKPILLALGYTEDNFAKETKQKLSKHDRWADYTLIVGNDYVLVEAEPMKKDLRMGASGIGQVQEWIESKRTNTDYGIATNGLEWIMVKFDRNSLRLRELKSINLQPIFSSFLGQEHLTAFDEILKDFYLTFSKNTIISSFKERYYTLEYQCDQISQKFYSEYIEYVFGISSKDGAEREYSLLKAISKPHSSTEADTNLFAITFMNRILFIKFLEDKGLIEKDLLVNLWNEYSKINDPLSSFYKNILEPLFFNVFNTPVLKRASKIKQNERFAKIPYLNGGLFREAVHNETQYNIDDDIIGKILIDFLGHYDFTISGEGLNPDVLGNIFERTINYISNPGTDRQKLLGAYYTPDDITTYMTIKAIHPFLLRKVKDYLLSKGWKEPDINEYKSLDDFLNNLPENPIHINNILAIVSDITVLDPACGSGHFLTSALNELMYVKETLLTRIGDKYSRYHLKKEIISQNIFGIDIEESAVEIAKLRLWLSLIEDVDTDSKKHIETLPNIEYNLVSGNSLIGWVNEKLTQTSFAVPMTEEVKGIFKGLLVESTKDTEYIEKARELLESPALEDYIEAYCVLYSVYKNSTDEKAVRLKEILTTVRDAIYNSINHSFLNYINQQMNSTKLKRPGVSLQKFLELRPFHWRVDFGPIIKRGGFDVIVGNPPHGSELKDLDKKICEIKYSLNERGMDSAKIFVERSVTLLLEKGILSFVIPKPSTYSYSWEDLREFVMNLDITHCIDFGKAFENVKHEQIGLIFINQPRKENAWKGGYYDKKNKEILETNNIPSSLFLGYKIILSNMNKIEIELSEYILSKNFPNMDSFDIFRGLPRSLATNSGIPCFRGKEIRRYYIEQPEDKIDVSKINDKNILRIKKEKIIAQRIIAHVTKPYEKIFLMSYPDTKCTLNFETVTNIIVPNKNYSVRSLSLLLNSKFIGWFVYNLIYNKAIRDMDFDAYFAKRIILPSQIKLEILDSISEYLCFLNSDISIRNKQEIILSYLDNVIVESLVYELYFKDKFVEDGIYSGIKIDLASLLEGCIPKIKYDEWSTLYWKKKLGEDLSPKEEQSLNSLEKDNLEMIKSTYDNLTKNKEIAELINRIKSNDWIKLIEGQ